MAGRSVDEKTILYDGNFSSCPPPTVAAFSGHCVFTDFTQLPSDDPATWPEAARVIAENAGLEPAYRGLLTKVPVTPDYGQFLPTGVSLANGSTKKADSGKWTGLKLLWDDRVNTGEATSSDPEPWVEYDFGQSYKHLALVVDRTNHGPIGETEWKVQLWDENLAAWKDALSWVGTASNRRQERRLPDEQTAARMRLLLRNTAKGGKPGIYEFRCLGIPAK
jgi:hypothetical protein